MPYITVADEAHMPLWSTAHSAGMDLKAYLAAPVEIAPGKEATVIPTGISIDHVPRDSSIQICSKSGLFAKHAVRAELVYNYKPGEEELSVNMASLHMSGHTYTLKDTEKCAQLIFNEGDGKPVRCRPLAAANATELNMTSGIRTTNTKEYFWENEEERNRFGDVPCIYKEISGLGNERCVFPGIIDADFPSPISIKEIHHPGKPGAVPGNTHAMLHTKRYVPAFKTMYVKVGREHEYTLRNLGKDDKRNGDGFGSTGRF